MQEMKANNLFGDDSPSPNTPVITEISLKDLCSSIDFDALKSQTVEDLEIQEENEEDCDIESDEDDKSCTFYLSQPPFSKRSSLAESYSKRPSIASSAKKNSIASSIRSKRSSSMCQDIPEIQIQSDDNSQNEYSEISNQNRKDPVLPNGNLHFANSYTITDCKPIYDDTNEEEVSLLRHNLNKSPPMPSKTRYKSNGSKRRTSWQESSVDDDDISDIQYDDITKDDLLLMWKASEMELSAKLQKALREKSRLQRLLVDLDTSQEPTPV